MPSVDFHKYFHNLSSISTYSIKGKVTELTGLVVKAVVPGVRIGELCLIQPYHNETPIKAGRKKKGKMRNAYFWPVMGGEKEIAFFYFDSREHRHVFTALCATPGDTSVIVSDGYGAYKAYAKAILGASLSRLRRLSPQRPKRR